MEFLTTTGPTPHSYHSGMKLKIKLKGGTSYSAKIVKLPDGNFNSADYQGNWTNIENSTTVYWSNVQFRSSEDMIELQDAGNFSNDVVSHEQQGTHLNIGIMSNDESTNGAIAEVAFEYVPVYTIPQYTFYFENSFGGGTILIDNSDRVSHGGNKIFYESSSHTMTAETQTYNSIERVWNSGSPQSQWSKRPYGNASAPILDAYSATYNYPSVLASDANATFIANMKNRYAISRTDQTEFDGTSSQGVVANIVESHSGTVTAPSQKTINGRQYSYASWSDTITLGNPRTIYNPTDNMTLTAWYKYPLHSNSTSAYANNSARKVVRSADGNLHIVYESMGKVWYEKMNSSGTSLALKRISYDNASNPSIAIVDDYNVAIVYQEYCSGISVIKLVLLNPSNNSVVETSTVAQTSQDFSSNLNPVIAGFYYGVFMIVWQEPYLDDSSPGGLFYMRGYCAPGSSPRISWLTTYSQDSPMPGTNSSSLNPTIGYTTQSYYTTFHLAWQQRVSATQSNIDYRTATPNGDDDFDFSSVTNVSSSGGYSKNERPSIVGAGTGARLSWIGSEDDEYTTVFKDPSYYAYWYFGNDVTSTSINISSDRYVIGWSEGSSQYITDSRTLSQVKTLNTNGADLQISNGSTSSTMYAVGYQSSSSPYSFQLSNNVASFGKGQTDKIANGRFGILSKAGVQFKFAVGDINVDGKIISFVDMPEKTKFSSVSDVNQYLISEPFTLNDNSTIAYDVQYGTTDSVLAAQILGKGRFISFKLELIEDKTEKKLADCENMSIAGNSIVKCSNNAYEISAKGMGRKTARLRLVLADNLSPEYAVASKYAASSALKKRDAKAKEIKIKTPVFATDYSLSQNYPNPFNPSTQISYQLKDAGIVRLGVYDILGREVAVLVNERQDAGFYSATWNAGTLSSGSYVYRISIMDDNGKSRLNETKRMMLMK
jgi:hypothetical protein